MAGVEAAPLAPNFLAMATEIIQFVGADRGGVKLVQEAKASEFAQRMRQGVDTDAKFPDRVRLLEQFTIDAPRAQHQRRGETSATAADDDRLHALDSNSVQRLCTS